METKLTDLFKNDWKNILIERLGEDYFLEMDQKLSLEQQNSAVFPSRNNLFEAFNKCSISSSRVVIIGQDPYHQPNQAHGLAFSVLDGIAFPPSLKNIFKELDSNQEKVIFRSSGNLGFWADQGVFLLNTVLSVSEGKPNSHKHLGWQRLTTEAIKIINDYRSNVVFLLWGNHAFQYEKYINTQKHLVLKAAHPSPLSANKGGWFGNNCFNVCNEYLVKSGQAPINWFESN